jgi:TatA/E family protein of Tat protein translocase
MGPLGWQEMVVIFVVALLLFGPKKLPELGKTVAKALSEFRRASDELKDTWNREMAAIERENQDIRREVQEVAQAASDSSSSSYSYDYGYDSSYDYGAYGYPDSAAADSTQSTEVSASATQGADIAASSEGSAGTAAQEPIEGTVPTSADAALDEKQADVNPQAATR